MFANPNQLPQGVAQVRHARTNGLNWSELQFGAVDPAKVAFPPEKAHDNDAGFDLYVTERVVLRPGEFADLPTNVWVALQDEYWGLVTGRSSALRKHGLLVHTGVIDAGYRGELFAGAFNLSGKQVVVEPGQRLAQFLVVPLPNLGAKWVEGEPPPGTRGSNGFGSTGR
ncbi:deoxyuridine triphosphatase [Gordonia phage Ghobes]|uniref:dUTP diphosphatase n=1 Tax=Gordonia phage Ghobes TaxID=1887647 RepID=A0A1B3B0B0_9CAUD|nr:dUTPase [Gordonia phage Ghobes]AOE44406.1 deoxyuridine triphosphatase [Gordonia phage Ghobes]